MKSTRMSLAGLALGALAGCSGGEVFEGSAFANMDGWRVGFEARGEGKRTILFVHGWAGASTIWRPQLDSMTGYRRVAVDLIGHGASDRPDVSYTMEFMARSVAAAMDELEIERAVIVGHSNGVPVVRQFYRMYPERTEALVAVDGSLRSVMPPGALEQMMVPLREPDYRETIEAMVSQMPRGVLSEGAFEHIVDLMLSTPQHVLISTGEAMLDPAIWVDDEIGVPLLVVNTKSPLWSDEYVAKLREIAPRMDYRTWDDATHFMTMEYPARFHETVAEFLQAID